MSHIHIRKLMESRTDYAGRSWSYDFRSIPEHCREETVTQTCLFQLPTSIWLGRRIRCE